MSLSNQTIMGPVNCCIANDRDSQKELYSLLHSDANNISYRYVNDEQEANALTNDFRELTGTI